MHVNMLHSWQVTPTEAIALQRSLQTRIVLAPVVGTPKIVAGVDVSYDRGTEIFHAGIVLLELPELVTLEEVSASGKVTFPYIPGLLTFREGPVVAEAFRRLQTRPDLVIFDGQGITHPRGLGIASHMGLMLDIPSMGCAKSRLCGEYDPPGLEKGRWSSLFLKGREVGAVVRTKDRVKPLFVSPGYRMDLDGALRITLQCTGKYRLPEPTRQAHLLVNRIRQEYRGEKEVGRL